jgi:hypothetical protein
LLVNENLKLGLQVLRPAAGQLITVVASWFEVPLQIQKIQGKAIVCASLLPRPRFAYVPRLRCLFAPRHGPTLISKRDARHYSRSSGLDHSGNEGWRAHLAMTTGWQPFLALEQLPWDLTASAGFAQGLTAVINYNQSHDDRD